MKVTLHDIARHARVHYATASTVLNGSRGSTRVSDETRRRVLSAAEVLGYNPNRAAQQLKTRRNRVVGLLVGDVENPFFARMVSLCSEALEQDGFEVVLATHRRDGRNDLHLLNTLLSRQLAGILLWSETNTEVRERVQRPDMAHVTVMGLDIPGRDSVTGDLVEGVRDALAHLRAEGFERIGYFAPLSALSQHGDPRYETYHEWVKAQNRTERVVSYENAGRDRVEAARERAEAFADDWKAQTPNARVDALFCFNDLAALGALMGLRRRGLRVPEDIALVGCDDLPLSAQLDTPLTTIAYPLAAMCRGAVDMMRERIVHGERDIRGDNEAAEGEPYAPRLQHFPTRLVVRESSRRVDVVP